MPDWVSAELDGIDKARTSPNHGPRAPGRERPDAIVLHYTGMADGPSAVAWLCEPASQVSCHYVVTEAGGLLQLVDERRRAWHAGRSVWFGETDLNSASIGIEIVNGGHDYGLPPFPEAQVAAVVRLCRDIVRRYAIAPARVLAHSDIAPGRKRDPGELFPWAVLAEAGIGLWPAPTSVADTAAACEPGDAGAAVARLQAGLAACGYGVPQSGAYDADTAAVVAAFQRHFRPGQVDGIADRETIARLRALEAAQPARKA